MVFQVEITRDVLANDIHVEFDNLQDALIYISQNALTEDGYRIIQYKEGSGATSLRTWPGGVDENDDPLPDVSSKAVLRVYGEDEAYSSTEYDTLAEAEAARDALNISDGFEIIDLEQPVGSAKTIVLERRPSLWGQDEPMASRQNGHGRLDKDRF